MGGATTSDEEPVDAGEWDNPPDSRRRSAHELVWDPIRPLHQGQRPNVPRQQAGHMNAPDHASKTVKALAHRGPSTHESPRAAAPQPFSNGHPPPPTKTTSITFSLTGTFG